MKTKSILSILMTLTMLSSIASAVEIRGTVVETDGGTTFVTGGSTSTYTWSAQEFAGFYYDLDTGVTFETLSIQGISVRTIQENNLVYTTSPIEVNFSYSDDKGKNIYDNIHSYNLVGWQAEKWVAITPNKLVKLIVEKTGSDKVSLQSGSTLTLGNGYVMKINSVDANSAPRQAWVSVSKDGVVIDDAVLQQGEVYNLQKDIGGEKDVLVLSAYVSSIFSGSEAQMLQLQYVWLIDESTLIEVNGGNTYGALKVISTNPITLSNSGIITLSEDSVVDIMGNMKFRVADSSTLRFYPYVEISDNMSASASSGTTSSRTSNTIYVDRWNNQTGTMVNGAFVNNTPCVPTTVDKIVEVEKIVYLESTSTTPTVVETIKAEEGNTIPGFEAVFAIAGLIAVAFIILRQKRKD